MDRPGVLHEGATFIPLDVTHVLLLSFYHRYRLSSCYSSVGGMVGSVVRTGDGVILIVGDMAISVVVPTINGVVSSIGDPVPTICGVAQWIRSRAGSVGKWSS
jgi:hypothetical protein